MKEERTLSKTTERKNEIRRNIKSFFKSVDAFTLPIPSDKEDVLAQMDKPEFRKYLNQEFLDQMETLKHSIEEKYHPKKGLNDSIITGTRKLYGYKTTFEYNEKFVVAITSCVKNSICKRKPDVLCAIRIIKVLV